MYKDSGVVIKIDRGGGVAVCDYDGDGFLDLYVANYVEYSLDEDLWCSSFESHKSYCGPNLYSPSPDNLFHNNGDGTFTDVSQAVGFTDTRIARGLVAFDYDRDGDQDLMVSNWKEDALLYENVGGAEEGNWIVVDLVGDAPNTHGLGATVAYADVVAVRSDMPIVRLNLEELLAWADIVSIHVPGGESTQSLIGPKQLGLMKEGGWLVNLCLPTETLAAKFALTLRKPKGGSVFGQEPLGTDNRCQFRLQDLEGDVAVVLQVFGQVDRGQCRPHRAHARWRSGLRGPRSDG